ncbi:hypothetical protein COCOBI_09-5710 [Coccomyxa sp. Obi]|nr:hypothetical protein COCOBI_09-5710 [Coccomyxa sp. Obi]
MEQIGFLPELVPLNGSGISLGSGKQEDLEGYAEKPADATGTSSHALTGLSNAAKSLLSHMQTMDEELRLLQDKIFAAMMAGNMPAVRNEQHKVQVLMQQKAEMQKEFTWLQQIRNHKIATAAAAVSGVATAGADSTGPAQPSGAGTAGKVITELHSSRAVDAIGKDVTEPPGAVAGKVLAFEFSL